VKACEVFPDEGKTSDKEFINNKASRTLGDNLAR
jgi:hypothetical protein